VSKKRRIKTLFLECNGETCWCTAEELTWRTEEENGYMKLVYVDYFSKVKTNKHISSKRRWTFIRLHSITSQKMAIFIFTAAWTSNVKKNIFRNPGTGKRNMSYCCVMKQSKPYIIFQLSQTFYSTFTEVISFVFSTCIPFNGVQHKLSDFIIILHIMNSSMGHLKYLAISLCNIINIQPATHQMGTLFLKILTRL
jgi:hypothetical protein